MGYDNRMWAKDTANWGVQIAGIIFQTRSSVEAQKSIGGMIYAYADCFP